MSEIFDANLAVLEERSPEAAAVVASRRHETTIQVALAATGAPILEQDGRPLDSRRDPIESARRLAGSVTTGPVVVAGLGMGYLAEAISARGIAIGAIVDADPGAVVAAMRTRDLRPLLRNVPLHLLTDRTDAVDLAFLRRLGPSIVVHAPATSSSPSLQALVREWNHIRVASRAPRVLVVGPICGGSVEMARASARAAMLCGAETRFFDATDYDKAFKTLGGLDLPVGAQKSLQGSFVDVIGEAVVMLAHRWRPDLVFALAQAPLPPAILDRIKGAGLTTAFWWVENNRVLPAWRMFAPKYDWFYAIQGESFLTRLSEAGAARPRYLPLGCDPEHHAPVTLTAEERKRFGADISFAGSPYLNRRHVFSALGDLGLRLWGPGWTDPALAPMAAEGRTFSLDEMMRIFAATKINLNLHSAEHVREFDLEPDYVNPRTFELAACGAFQLVDRRDPLPALFDEEEVVSFSSVAELRDQIRKYLRDGEARARHAARAKARAIAEHTYAHRLRRVFRDTLPPELTAAALAGVTAQSLDEAITVAGQTDVMNREEALLLAVREVKRTWADKS